MRSKRKLLLTAAFTALLGIGAFAGVSLTKESAKPAKVEAAGTTRLYLDMTSFADWYGDSAIFRVHTWNSAKGDQYHTATKVADAYWYADVDLNTYASGGGWRFNRCAPGSTGSSNWNQGAWNSGATNNYYKPTGYTSGVFYNVGGWKVVGATSGTWTAETQDIDIPLSEPRFDADGLQFLNTTVSLTENSVFKITDGSTYYGFGKLGSYDGQSANEKGYIVTTGGDSDPNIRVAVSGVYEVYVKPMAGSDNLWIQLSSASEADAYAQEFLDVISCNGETTTFTIDKWNNKSGTSSMEYKYSHLTKGAKDLLTEAIANKDGTNVEKCVARYDRILGKYGYGTGSNDYHDFMDRKPAKSGSAAILINSIANGSTGSMIAIIAISVTSLAAIGGYFLFRKKKEN